MGQILNHSRWLADSAANDRRHNMVRAGRWPVHHLKSIVSGWTGGPVPIKTKEKRKKKKRKRKKEGSFQDNFKDNFCFYHIRAFPCVPTPTEFGVWRSTTSCPTQLNLNWGELCNKSMTAHTQPATEYIEILFRGCTPYSCSEIPNILPPTLC